MLEVLIIYFVILAFCRILLYRLFCMLGLFSITAVFQCCADKHIPDRCTLTPPVLISRFKCYKRDGSFFCNIGILCTVAWVIVAEACPGRNMFIRIHGNCVRYQNRHIHIYWRHMDREMYIRVMDFIRSHKYGVNVIYITGKAITYLTAIIYLLTIALLVYKGDMRFIRIITVPAASFIVLTVFRAKYDAKRPYEKYNFKPLITKDTHGKSFPSRHVFSIFICAGAVNYIYPLPGAAIYIMGILLAVIRVITGVHFPKDVIAGALAGILCSIAGFTDL